MDLHGGVCKLHFLDERFGEARHAHMDCGGTLQHRNRLGMRDGLEVLAVGNKDLK